MDQPQNDQTTNMANQAWRKRPRQFAPKSRLGCKTCKIRRVKCDLTQPSCLKCQRTGRTCDGYRGLPPNYGTEVESSHYYYNDKVNIAERRETHQSSTAISTRQPIQKRWHLEDHCGLGLQNPGPFMILPMTGSTSTEAMSFFEYISIKDLNKYQFCDEPWRKTLMFFSQTVPSVRHAATALALLHRNYIDSKSYSDDRVQSQSSNDWWLSDQNAPLFHYTLAIQHLLNQDSTDHDSAERTAITLLVCYLFTCYDHLAGNDVQAMKHLRGGVELSRHFNKTTLNNNDGPGDDANSSEVQKLVYQVTSQIRRLDRQAVIFLLDWTPTDIQETAMHHLAPSDSAFVSLGQAADSIQFLIAQMMSLHNTEQQMYPMGKIPPPPSLLLKDILLGQLKTWSSLFKNMLQSQGSSSSCETDTEKNTLITILRLQSKIVWILLGSYGPGREMEYDSFLPQFQQCLALAREVTAAHERYSGSLKPTFTPEIGILPILYIIGAKCRHALVRREVLDILRRQSIREAVWNSIYTARVLERVIEIEEGSSEEGIVPRSMDQIAVWQRIEALSWKHVHSGSCAPRLDITYTFCMQEGIHTESLMI
ncbi:hypothetical protein FSARC_9445 [Fusarium sarcochroum]|uniref:Zn(2)-C6 fungal-type domain-containing protein n=1 Tax=Fusarium sarcochroum TaxID=1208366 RepID=A0A8H4X5A6_9HYPO|nr:hypothetical protein FSARC_9445 [Fusarium sarcochroum]